VFPCGGQVHKQGFLVLKFHLEKCNGTIDEGHAFFKRAYCALIHDAPQGLERFCVEGLVLHFMP
jgi:hypothetical protein